jgi:4-aminobutyrate aminotransferase-like enzyme
MGTFHGIYKEAMALMGSVPHQETEYSAFKTSVSIKSAVTFRNDITCFWKMINGFFLDVKFSQ